MNKETAQKIKAMLDEIKNEADLKSKREKVSQFLAFLDGYITNILSS